MSPLSSTGEAYAALLCARETQRRHLLEDHGADDEYSGALGMWAQRTQADRRRAVRLCSALAQMKVGLACLATTYKEDGRTVRALSSSSAKASTKASNTVLTHYATLSLSLVICCMWRVITNATQLLTLTVISTGARAEC